MELVVLKLSKVMVLMFNKISGSLGGEKTCVVKRSGYKKAITGLLPDIAHVKI